MVKLCIWFKEEQVSSPRAKQHRVKPVPSCRNIMQGWGNLRESSSCALEQGTLMKRTPPKEVTNKTPEEIHSHRQKPKGDLKIFFLYEGVKKTAPRGHRCCRMSQRANWCSHQIYWLNSRAEIMTYEMAVRHFMPFGLRN